LESQGKRDFSKQSLKIFEINQTELSWYECKKNIIIESDEISILAAREAQPLQSDTAANYSEHWLNTQA